MRDARTHDEPFLTILLVVSRKSVSLGDILWNTTFWILDLPLLHDTTRHDTTAQHIA
jgi:hypothetical protein